MGDEYAPVIRRRLFKVEFPRTKQKKQSRKHKTGQGDMVDTWDLER
jgi:hypothetical protein